MEHWLRKISVILVAILTLGMYIPPTYLEADAAESKEVSSSRNNHNEALITSSAGVDEDQQLDNLLEDIGENPIDVVAERAKTQTVTKLGPKIISKVEHEITDTIFPEMEEVIHNIITHAGDEVPYYEITEELSPGYGEKIFNLYDYRTGEELAKFHVRRDKRPGEGYWFNFHYHLRDDNFEKHHTIGEVYWDKNTPPKWMA
ncbi:YpjP family protein [Thalassobacillus pellis]|uniref:YpjP family protein n=1 Tax=Thalassobacillus pellis TaxID=748008 RepID=UPI001961FACD|nr:YpjP family protein [Thalassobacillus pellis]MBM7554283.1 hypothetical protein [Thalassobacillus pellis]